VSEQPIRAFQQRKPFSFAQVSRDLRFDVLHIGVHVSIRPTGFAGKGRISGGADGHALLCQEGCVKHPCKNAEIFRFCWGGEHGKKITAAWPTDIHSYFSTIM
jgi:hypothetical protein